MQQNKLLEQLMGIFLEELEEHVQTLNEGLLALERGVADAERAELLKELFRAAHSLKGAARSTNVSLIEQACHAMEGFLAQLRDDHITPGPELFELLFAAVDAVEDAGGRLREERALEGSPLEALLPRLEAPPDTSPTTGPEEAGTGEAESSSPSGPASREAAPEDPPPRSQEEQTERAAIAPEHAKAACVRVQADKLDAFLAHVGEMRIARNRVELRSRDSAALQEFVKAWAADWRRKERPLREIFAGGGFEGKGAGKGNAAAATELPEALQGLDRTRESLEWLDRELERMTTALTEDVRVLGRTGELLEEDVRRARMLPFSEACQGLDRMLRDLAKASEKDVELRLEGGDIELDRHILTSLKDPLRHLMRNAVDHGIEPPEERRRSGKTSRARITVSAALRNSHVEVSVADDGRGFDLEAIRERARRKGLAEPANERDAMRLIFCPGFSTAPIITEVSGRGVGLDVVKAQVDALHGRVEVHSEPGAGARFSLSVPLTLTTMRAILISAAGQTFALANTNTQRLAQATSKNLRSVEGREVLVLGETPTPVAFLADALGMPGGGDACHEGNLPIVFVVADGEEVALVVDEMVAEQEIVVKGLGHRLRGLEEVSGATILPTGEIALILNAGSLVRKVIAGKVSKKISTAIRPSAQKTRKRILVVDDSITTRSLERSILEAVGYEVSVAVDGAEAWRLLREESADLVVTDVDMPIMNGFELTENIRHSEDFWELPVILVTGLSSDEDKARGIEVGASAYLVKSDFDQASLLETVSQLMI